MQVLDHYPTDPGCCRICGTDTTPTVDTGVFTDELGGLQGLYLCRGCVTSAAQALGWLPPDSGKPVEAELARMKSMASTQGKKAAGLAKVLDGFIESGKFQVSAELFDELSPEAQESVLKRLPKKIREKVES